MRFRLICIILRWKETDRANMESFCASRFVRLAAPKRAAGRAGRSQLGLPSATDRVAEEGDRLGSHVWRFGRIRICGVRRLYRSGGDRHCESQVLTSLMATPMTL